MEEKLGKQKKGSKKRLRFGERSYMLCQVLMQRNKYT